MIRYFCSLIVLLWVYSYAQDCSAIGPVQQWKSSKEDSAAIPILKQEVRVDLKKMGSCQTYILSETLLSEIKENGFWEKESDSLIYRVEFDFPFYLYDEKDHIIIDFKQFKDDNFSFYGLNKAKDKLLFHAISGNRWESFVEVYFKDGKFRTNYIDVKDPIF